jgi:ribose transport system permease protein
MSVTVDGTGAAGAGAARTRRGLRMPRGLSPWLGPAWIWALLLVVVLFGFYFVADFWRTDNLTSILRQSIPLALVAIGQTFVILTGGLDISVAAVISLTNTMAMGLMAGSDGAIAYAIVVPLIAAAFVGFVNGAVVTYARVPAFIVTLGAASIVQGIVFAYTDYATFGTPAPAVSELGFADWGPLPALVWLFLPILVIALVLQNRSRGGRHVYAVGGSEASARLAGISLARVKIGAYVISAVLAGLAGIVLTTRTGGGEPLVGTGYDWDAIAAVVIGGTLLRGGKGGIAGTVVAVLLLSTVDNLMNLSDVSAFWQSLVKGLIVLSAVVAAAVVALRPLEAWRERRAGLEGGVG